MSESFTYMMQQGASKLAKAINVTEIEQIVTNMSLDDESTRNGEKLRRKTTTRVRRNMHDHQNENKKGHQEIQPRYHTKTIMASKDLRKVRRMQKLGKDRLITLLDKQGRKIHDQDKIIERIEKFYIELNDSELRTIIHNDPKEIPEIHHGR